MMTSDKTSIVHYWGGQPRVRTSRFDWHHAILDECRKKGWRSILVFSSPLQNEEAIRILKESDIECFYIARPKHQFDFKCIIDSYRFFRKVRCTLAHFHCVHTSPIIGAALAGVPIRIWSNHSSEFRDDGKVPGGIHSLGLSTRVTCTLSHKILPVSKSIKDEILRFNVSEDKIRIAPVPISLKRYRTSQNVRKSMRASFGFPDNNIIICSVGQGIYRKGWDILINAFAKALIKISHMNLLLVGHTGLKTNNGIDSYQKSLFNSVIKLGIKDKVNFLGIRHDIVEILSASDIFAFPSRAEGLPIALLEAMAAGLPCVASSVSGIPEVISNYDNGILIENEDTDSLAEILISLAKDRNMRRKLSEKAILSLNEFSLEHQVSHIIKLYEELLDERRPAQVEILKDE
jgi:glycosyltransferase involved in cell wall biosynthesis